MIDALNPEDEPQDYLSADELPDPNATLDADMAGDPGPDVFEAEEAPADAAESDREREASKYQHALEPYYAKHARQLSAYVIDEAEKLPMVGATPDEIRERSSEIIDAAKQALDLDRSLVRNKVEQEHRLDLNTAAALKALKQDQTKDGDKR